MEGRAGVRGQSMNVSSVCRQAIDCWQAAMGQGGVRGGMSGSSACAQRCGRRRKPGGVAWGGPPTCLHQRLPHLSHFSHLSHLPATPISWLCFDAPAARLGPLSRTVPSPAKTLSPHTGPYCFVLGLVLCCRAWLHLTTCTACLTHWSKEGETGRGPNAGQRRAALNV